MDIVIIGSGNVAAVLGRRLRAAGHAILQIYSRNAPAASALAYELDTESSNYKSMINRNAEIYLIAVADDAIDDVTDDLNLPGKIIAHTAAAVPKEVLKGVSDNYGVFYPLQTLRKDTTVATDIPIFIDGSNDITRRRLEDLAHSISGEKVIAADEESRMKLHVAAVVVNNFTNHLFALAEEYCRKEGLQFKQLIPLISETVARLKDESPAKVQTGPAIRQDQETIEKHLAILHAHPRLKNIYTILTESIQQGK